jgi:GT2 family glycosyltransferase
MQNALAGDMTSVAPITAIVVAHNSAQVLPACFDSLHSAGLAALVVDNASADQSTTLARDAGAEVIANDKNQGFGRAINQALAHANSEFCLIINPDIAFDADAPAQLLELLRAAPNAAMVAPKLLEPDGRLFELRDSPINAAAASTAPAGAAARALLSGAALLARRDKLLAIGGFDPNIFLFWEDNDLCRRLIDAGDTLLLAGSVVMRHKRGGSSTPAPGAVYLRRWHQAWSRFYVFKKFGVASKPDQWIARFSRKAMLAELARSPVRVERYSGSRDGAIAFHEGKTALAHQGLA